MKENAFGCLHLIFGGLMLVGAAMMFLGGIQLALSLFGETHRIFEQFADPGRAGATAFFLGLGMMLTGRFVDWLLAKISRRVLYGSYP